MERRGGVMEMMVHCALGVRGSGNMMSSVSLEPHG